ncbi:MAG: DUF4345 domain-containing protein [Robiginitomaculum sp.]|nr:DUF4345 domain-containing protein [Robiginitomaculum sp.]
MTKSILFIIALISTAFGLSFIFAPHIFFEMFTDATFPTTSAAIDVRTTYGGFSLGFGLFLFYCLKNNLKIGLFAALLTLTSITAARILGIAIDGDPNKYVYIFLGMEIVAVIAAYWAWRREGRKEAG